jgi:hypothetical protein
MGGGRWEPAKGTVVARRDSSKFAMGSMSTQKRYEYVMDLTPVRGGRPFSATMVTPMFCGRWQPLDVGDVVTVLCQPDNEKVKWDRREPSTNRYAMQKSYEHRRKQEADAEFDQALSERPDARR